MARHESRTVTVTAGKRLLKVLMNFSFILVVVKSGRLGVIFCNGLKAGWKKYKKITQHNLLVNENPQKILERRYLEGMIS